MDERKIKKFGIFDFKNPVSQRVYMRLYRSRDPVRQIKSMERELDIELVDREKAREKYRRLCRLLLSVIPLILATGFIKCSYLLLSLTLTT